MVRNKEAIETAILESAELVKQDRTDELLLAVARSSLNYSGKLYDLWCDNTGNCVLCCIGADDDSQLACIRRFLEREIPEDE